MSKISEFVSLGHPDKIADYISEFILDELIKQDEDTKYALGILNPDWYRQAMIRAEFFARDGVKSELELKELLEGEQFDEDQAEYGAVKALQK